MDTIIFLDKRKVELLYLSPHVIVYPISKTEIVLEQNIYGIKIKLPITWSSAREIINAFHKGISCEDAIQLLARIIPAMESQNLLKILMQKCIIG